MLHGAIFHAWQMLAAQPDLSSHAGVGSAVVLLCAWGTRKFARRWDWMSDDGGNGE